ncbi:MAG: hypothetical protein R3E96_17470 [Planctomycetota bacterium]
MVTLGFVTRVATEGPRGGHDQSITPACPVKDQLRDQARRHIAPFPASNTSTWR